MQYTTVEVFTARNYDVKLVELFILHFAFCMTRIVLVF